MSIFTKSFFVPGYFYERAFLAMACGWLSQVSFVFIAVDGPPACETVWKCCVFFFFRQHHTANVRMLCLDIEDLFYSMPHDVLLIETRECIDRQGLVNFYNSAVVSVDGFLELRVFYLKSMYLLFEGKVLPRRAVCVLAREWPRL